MLHFCFREVFMNLIIFLCSVLSFSMMQNNNNNKIARFFNENKKVWLQQS